jgi:Methyltransferase domain
MAEPAAASPPPPARIVVHLGAGGVGDVHRLHGLFHAPGWRVVRVDPDPAMKPHLVAPLTDLRQINSGAAHAVWTMNTLEHLWAHEVPALFRECVRMLTPDGVFMALVPDLQRICTLIAKDLLEEAAYPTPAGPIAPIDMLYGFRDALARGRVDQAHRTGFTGKTITQLLTAAGFQHVKVTQGNLFELLVVAYKRAPPPGPSDASYKPPDLLPG